MTGLSFVTAEQAVPDTYNVLLFGPPKSGKTTAAATAPGPILWANAEGAGALGFARRIAAERGTEIHELPIPDGRQNGTGAASPILHALVDHIRSGNDPQPMTVVVDTLGKVRDALVAEMVVPGAKNSIQQWGKVADTITQFVRALRDLPVNVVLLAHVDQVDDAESGRTVRPLIGGKATETVPGEVDVVAFTAPLSVDGEPTRYVGQLVDGRGRVGLGDRSGGIAGDQSFRELDLTEWLARYRAALTPSTVSTAAVPSPAPAESESEPAVELVSERQAADLLAGAQALAENGVRCGTVLVSLGAQQGSSLEETIRSLPAASVDQVTRLMNGKFDEIAAADESAEPAMTPGEAVAEGM